jgi:hypothetical protein
MVEVLDGAALDDPSREPKPVMGVLDVPVALLEIVFPDGRL